MAGLNGIINLAAIGASEEAEILAHIHRRHYRHIMEPLDELTDSQFIKIYRLNKPMVEEVMNMVEPYINTARIASGLSISTKVLTTSRFFASGSYQLDVVGNINHAISQSSVSKAIKEVTDALNRPEIFNAYVRLPRNIEELRRVCNSFYQNHQFPGVIGYVDCTHIAIYPPPINHHLYPEAAYVNRKGYHSINVQLICYSNLRIQNVCARFSGSTHDMYIWNNSGAYQYIRNLHLMGNKSFYLLGDSGYSLRRWLLTPIANAEENTREALYNRRLISTRSLIERCNGVLKLRFRCLLKHRVLHYAPDRCSKIINSCTVLHNMCIDNNLPPVNFGDEDEDHFVGIDYGQYDVENLEPLALRLGRRINPDLEAGRQLQQMLLRNHFNNQ